MLPNFHPHARRSILFATALAAKAVNLQSAISNPQSEDAGWIEGYLAVWGNVDSQGEVMVRGCFARSIQQVVAAGKVPLMVRHFRDGGDVLDAIGTISQAREDERGLWIHADLDASPAAQDVRAQVLAGRVSGLSVGFRVIRAELRENVVYRTESALMEGTVTMRPANPEAQILAAKEATTATTATNATEIENAPGQTGGKQTPCTQTADYPPPGPLGPVGLPSLATRAKREVEVRRARLALLANGCETN